MFKADLQLSNILVFLNTYSLLCPVVLHVELFVCPSGHYLYVDASYGSITSQAELTGPTLHGCSTTCQFQMWYNMYGTGMSL